jgi:rubredoxin
MTTKKVALTCPSCGFSKDVPAEKIPPLAVNATCRACGHIFSLADHVASPTEVPSEDDFRFEAIPPPPTAPPKADEFSRMVVHPPRSSFVTAVAWVFIALCGFATFVSILQNVMLNTIMPLDEMRNAVTDPGFTEMPALFRFMMGNVRLFFASFLVVSATMLGAAVGLLKRKKWARLLFITILSLGIVWNIVGIALQFFFLQDFPKPVGAPPEFVATFSTMRTVIMVFSALMALGFSALFGWLIKRFTSSEIRREFS